MAGVDLGGGAPAEGEAAVAAELAPVFRIERRDYLKSNYSAVSLAEAVRQLLPKAAITVVAGTGVVPSEPTDIPAIVATARNADVVILAVGARSAWSNECTEGEGSDTANKDLPPQQVELIHAVTALGKPTVAVISMGGPYALATVIDTLPAVLTDYYGGPHQAIALAGAIFGVTNPGGKLDRRVRGIHLRPLHCRRVDGGSRAGIAPWRDTGVQLTGPAVADAEAAFADAWGLAGRPVPPAELPHREAIPAAGTVTLRVIASAPETTALYRMDLLVAVAARERLWLTDAYFMATPPYRQALRAAALDGVDVRLLVPHGSDIEWIANVFRTMYRSLLEAGVRASSSGMARWCMRRRRWPTSAGPVSAPRTSTSRAGSATGSST
jgi:hypothetical protein